ncbi:MAG: TlyA family RNA methyltransferase [Actinomycetes bacterium]|jgi:23S rRNA (cytidine1920-2'-O)/16S rRNA (cytidine1409-2'-O)-methyltransferase|nr:TlyA family RNA methyltransferase [Actinomycetes bacterium]
MAKRYTGPFVSRGGEKLAGALDSFQLDSGGLRTLDVGASTGGFTDCLLQRGVASVVALDVAYGQLAWSLRTDSRVTVLERSNFRRLDLREIGAPFDLTVADLSFISLAKVLPQLAVAAGQSGQLLLLVKPQFEARREEVGQGGVIEDAAVHCEVLKRLDAALPAAGLMALDWTYSPIKGPKGNREYWLRAAPAASDTPAFSGSIEEVVASAHRAL